MVRMRGGAADFMTQGRGHFKRDQDGVITVPDDMVGLAEANGYHRIDGTPAPETTEAVADPRDGQIAELTQRLTESEETVAHLRQELDTADEKRGLELSTSLTKVDGEGAATIAVSPIAAEEYHEGRAAGLSNEDAYELAFGGERRAPLEEQPVKLAEAEEAGALPDEDRRTPEA